MEDILGTKRIIRDIFNKVEGLLEEKEGEFLYNMAKACKDKEGVIVEVGSWKGRSTICLGKGSKAGNKVKIYSIDPHRNTPTHKDLRQSQTDEDFRKNIQAAGVSELITSIIQTSAEAAKAFNQTVQFLFIDAEHDYESVKLDFLSWYTKVAYGGIIAFHDHIFCGVRKVIEEYVHISKHFKAIGIVDSIFYVQKVKQNSVRDRLMNILLFFVFRCADLYHRFPLPKPLTKLTVRILRPLRIIK